jgi:hypothetical protein
MHELVNRRSITQHPFHGSMEDTMRTPNVNDVVRLTTDVPELSLHRGELGTVRSTWFAPAVAYEVEFRNTGNDCLTLALLREEQVMVEESAVVSSW